MSEDEARWQEYDAAIRRVVTCPDPDCTPEDHIRSLRFVALTAYNDGYAAGRPTRTPRGLL
jgi:hypothetical protein